jgi:HSF-type DNA-binding
MSDNYVNVNEIKKEEGSNLIDMDVVGTSAAAVTPPTNPTPTPVPMPSHSALTNVSAENPNVAREQMGVNNLDSETLKVSVDAAIESIMNNSNLQATLSPQAVPDTNTSEFGDDSKTKQEQLRAMYLAGFRAAAQQRQHHQSLSENFERAKHVPHSFGADVIPSAIVIPVESSVAAGVIKIQSNGSTPLTSHAQVMMNTNGRVTRASSSPQTTSPAVSSVSSSPGASTGHSNPFPRKLMEMLRKEDASVVAWLPRGDAFTCRDPDRFVSDILPRYFRHTKVRDFTNLFFFRCGCLNWLFLCS